MDSAGLPELNVPSLPIFRGGSHHCTTGDHMGIRMLQAVRAVLVATVGLSLAGCATLAPQTDLTSTTEREMTVGVVQKDIHKGMDQASVAEALGSPNIVTKDKDGRETWIYDKIASEVSYSKSESFGTLLLIGRSKDTGASSSSQKTLTVVIKYDEANLVDTFTYHSSKF